MPDRVANSWPLAHLRLSTEGVRLRPMTESDLDALGAILPPDLEMNPHRSRPFAVPEGASRAVALRQEYWTAMGAWTPDSWRLPFVVEVEDRIIGYQDLEAADFAVIRSVETASWLVPESRGRGWGKVARTAVLSLAFDGLEAEMALTEAWVDNAASLCVSRSLGYKPNGSVPRNRGGAAVEMPRMRLNRSDWLSTRRPTVTIDRLEPCVPWFVAGNPAKE